MLYRMFFPCLGLSAYILCHLAFHGGPDLSNMITLDLFLAKFLLILVVSFWVTSLRWLFDFIGKKFKTLVQAIKILYFDWHSNLFSGLDKFIMSKWMLPQSPYLYCITYKYILVCPPLLLRCQFLLSFIP